MPCNQNRSALPFRILIAPLDWGLGHATRCIPVIRYLLEKECEVIIAGSGATAILLKENFPALQQLPLSGYNITYSRSGGTFAVKILSQIPRILRAIRHERQWLREIQATHQFDLVISDNRYGLKIDGLKSVIMTHQLQIMTGFGKVADYLIRKMHYHMLEKFDECWVVDEQENGGLAGALSHPGGIPSNAHYAGLLSQLPALENHSGQNGKILVLLSGPEPMRSILERKILEQVADIQDYRFHIIAGNPGGAPPGGGPPGGGPPGGARPHLPSHVTYATHASAGELAEALSKAQLVICRSGYSTLMDLVMQKKKALLIPTPGQSEQEYLAGYLEARGIALSRQQSRLDLRTDITRALGFNGFQAKAHSAKQHTMRHVVDRILKQLI